ncbi:NUDIX domain-containing protein [Solibacillus sp. CAU 1738]|uniref:NUDIX hydrolase n=1 Tax=Solibacillus sp. CAU 1738 TaxID=3140363 RepID=UPI0032605CF5
MDYIQTIRKLIGNEVLMTVGCGIIIEQENKILLQHRKDRDVWGIPGGFMELGETVLETAVRETFEETGLRVEQLKLFGIYSGKEGFAEYPNGDKVFSIQIIFHSSCFSGELMHDTEESHEHRFFTRNNLPHLNAHQERFIQDWVNQVTLPIIK